jgi:hypothetical protein
VKFFEAFFFFFFLVFAESSYTQLYKVMFEAPDPAPFIENLILMTNKSEGLQTLCIEIREQLNDIESENHRLREETNSLIVQRG